MSQKKVGFILALLGLSALIVSLFNKKTRALSFRLLGLGSSLAGNYLAAKYSPQLAKVISSSIPSIGNKGGRSKKKVFSRKQTTLRPQIAM